MSGVLPMVAVVGTAAAAGTPARRVFVRRLTPSVLGVGRAGGDLRPVRIHVAEKIRADT